HVASPSLLFLQERSEVPEGPPGADVHDRPGWLQREPGAKRRRPPGAQEPHNDLRVRRAGVLHQVVRADQVSADTREATARATGRTPPALTEQPPGPDAAA